VILSAIFLTHKLFFSLDFMVHCGTFLGALLHFDLECCATSAVVVNNKGGMWTASQEDYIILVAAKIHN
jgi:hypothetical protein